MPEIIGGRVRHGGFGFVGWDLAGRGLNENPNHASQFGTFGRF